MWELSQMQSVLLRELWWNLFELYNVHFRLICDIDTRIGKAQGSSMLFLQYGYLQVRKATKMHLFKATVKSILLYGSDSWSLTKSLQKRLHGTYTGILRKVQNISWKDKVTNNFLYSSNPCLTEIIRRKRLCLAGHVSRPNEPAGSVRLWEPDERRRMGRPKITLKKILEDDTGLEAHELQTVMLDRVS